MTSRTENPLSRSLEKKTKKKKRQLLWSYILEVGRTQKYGLEPNSNRTLVFRTELEPNFLIVYRTELKPNLSISNRTRTELFGVKSNSNRAFYSTSNHIGTIYFITKLNPK
ncbi:unnamed protein product [Macrosiphum euphorbiae]|uniref:Uncharacterized protein n=1 Tax=Macrosiphum euphorbiae TaxID=13131 RepID=A0AAV0VZU4_9HEMI|nr:unnamed protein product [Macrosiphum euphorbiae]